MVAYSFKKQFADAVRSGQKTQTIRAPRKPPSRHARVGEDVQLYCGARTKNIELMGEAICEATSDVHLDFGRNIVRLDAVEYQTSNSAELDGFAQRDGFANWAEMKWWFVSVHGAADVFDGVLIKWRLK